MSKLSEARRRIELMGMAEAQEELKKQRRQLFDLRMQLARGEVKNNRQFPQIRADIARLMYHISELNREARKELARARQAGTAVAEPEQAPASEPASEPAAESATRPARRTRATAPKAEAASEAPATAASAAAATPAAADEAEETVTAASDETDETDEADEASSETK